MREGQFIKQNKERWDSYLEETEDPDEMAKRFTYLVDDLGYAKTHYPFSKIVKYINGIAAGIYLSIYKNKKEKSNRLVTYFKTELPLILYRNRRVLRFAFFFFIAFVAMGAFSSWQDPSFVRGILGDDYVNKTEENIARGDPFGVYKNENELVMFLMIAWNNIQVTMLCFTFGLLFSVGTLYILFKNGLMLGAFEQMFFAHNLGIRSILVIFIHGTLEISAIILAGGAGMIMGNSILFPRTYSRIDSFKRGA
ncbi:MAG TPA: stage II sporulation protein M, partial [Chitinophagaceae bacterium]|nr:stage II sporulation protein M [Chitinophagaceae bacterium]